MTVKPWPDAYDERVKAARIERNENARPEPASRVDSLADDVVVYPGLPNWRGTVPMALFAFLEQDDFPGRTVVPFRASNGGAMGRGERHIASLAPGRGSRAACPRGAPDPPGRPTPRGNGRPDSICPDPPGRDGNLARNIICPTIRPRIDCGQTMSRLRTDQ